MPTFDATERFFNDFARLTPAEKQAFRVARDKFVAALKANQVDPPFPADLRIKLVQGTHGIWEMTWQWPDGRATWSYGEQVISGQVHIVWRRCGGHDIFKKP
jgi:hypothetical protein